MFRETNRSTLLNHGSGGFNMLNQQSVRIKSHQYNWNIECHLHDLWCLTCSFHDNWRNLLLDSWGFQSQVCTKFNRFLSTCIVVYESISKLGSLKSIGFLRGFTISQWFGKVPGFETQYGLTSTSVGLWAFVKRIHTSTYTSKLKYL